jgi:hypothetical protein
MAGKGLQMTPNASWERDDTRMGDADLKALYDGENGL